MKKPHVIVSGSLAHDRIMDFPGKFADHIIREKIHELSVAFTIGKVRNGFGGTAGNIGYGLRLLGTSVSLAATLGKSDTKYLTHLKRLRLFDPSVQLIAGAETAAAYIMTDKMDNQITAFYPGALATPYTRSLRSLCKPRYLNYLLLAPAPVRTTVRLVREARALGLPYAFDPGQETTSYTRADMCRILTTADICLANDYEWRLIEKITGWSQSRIRQTVHISVKTLGPKGSVIWHHDERHSIPSAKPKKVLDPTGAGDAYRAGFVTGYLHGLPLPVAGRLGALAAVYAVEAHGTQVHKYTQKEFNLRYYRNFKKKITP